MLLQDMMRNGFSGSLICSAENNKEGESAGGEDKDKKAVLDDDTKKFINQAITSQFRRGFVQEMITKSVSESVGTAVKDVLGEFQQQQIQNSSSGDDSGNENEEVKALKARLKEQEQKFEAMQRETRDKEERAARSEERGFLESQLRKQGVPDTRLRAAVSLIRHELDTVRRDESNRIIWMAQRDGYTEPLSVEDGVKEFLKTDEGKTFLPPVNAGGTGDRGGTAPSPGTNVNMTKDEARHILGEFLMSGGQAKT